MGAPASASPQSSVLNRLNYWRRIASAYLLSSNSNLTFWHERPANRADARPDGPYYMTFADKASYPGPFDAAGVPLLDYHGTIGRQYNPIAIAQYGLARWNRHLDTGSAQDRAAFLAQADWLAAHLEPNAAGVPVWMHRFDFDYRERLRAPWYSGLAQGQGLSLLARASAATRDPRYSLAARKAFASLTRGVNDAGVLFRGDGGTWIEEYLVTPPSHILNGFIWALWGVRDYAAAEKSAQAEALFMECVETLVRVLPRYDTGSWSLYELSPTLLPMVASSFYHRLHVVQLRALAGMTGLSVFSEFADRWEKYASCRANRAANLARKAAFKLLYY